MYPTSKPLDAEGTKMTLFISTTKELRMHVVILLDIMYFPLNKPVQNISPNLTIFAKQNEKQTPLYTSNKSVLFSRTAAPDQQDPF